MGPSSGIGASKRPRPDDGAGARPGYVPSSKVASIMQRLGYVEGDGLGKHGQGLAQAVEPQDHVGTLGLGYNVPGLTDVPRQEAPAVDALDPLPAPQWLDAPDTAPPDVATLRQWVLEAPRKESISDEKEFVDAAALAGMLRAKSALDHVKTNPGAFKSARQRANPFDGIGREFFMTRAALKMAAIDAACDFGLTLPGAAKASSAVAQRLSDEAAALAEQEQQQQAPPAATRGGADEGVPLLYFADVAAGPGSFSEYVLWRRGPSAKGIGFTLREDDDFTCNFFHHRALPELFHPYYGHYGDGNLYWTENLRSLFQLVKRQTHKAGLHLVMADGGFDVEGKENIQEIVHKRLLLAQCIVPLATLRSGGNFVCKCFDLFTPFSASLVYLLHRHFGRICIYKPAQSRPANSERYILCRDYRRGAHTKDLVEHLLGVNDRLNQLAQAWETSPPGPDVSSLVPLSVLREGPFAAYLRASNTRLASTQEAALKLLVQYMKNPGDISADQSAVRDDCLAAWGLPARVAGRVDHYDAEAFFRGEIECGDSLLRRRVQPTPLRPCDLDLDAPESQLRQTEDWAVFDAQTTAPPVFVMGADGGALRGRAVAAGLHPPEWLPVAGLRLPRGTLLLAEVDVEEVGAEGGVPSVAVYAVDAAVIAGDDLRRLPYAERRRRLATLVAALDRDNELLQQQAGGPTLPPHVPLRLKKVYSLLDLREALLETRHGLLFFPGHGTAPPPPLEPREEWTGPHLSRSQQANYWQNKRTGASVFERDRVRRPLSFRSCVSSYLQWSPTAPGGVSEHNLAMLGADVRAKRLVQSGALHDS